MTNSARVEAEHQDGRVQTLKEEVLDPLPGLYTPGDHAHARVNFSVGTQVAFGKVKISATVGYECDQRTAVVDQAGLLAFTKAVEFMHDGLGLLAHEQEEKMTP